MRPLAARRRHLGPPQMAFVRCWAEGLDLMVAWHRFMAEGGQADARQARAELQRLLDELRGLARALGRPELAALLHRDPDAITDKGPKLLSLDDFRDRQPADFYSEAELSALYAAEFGALDVRGAVRRRQRLRARLVLALQWLAGRASPEPKTDDLAAAWLDERVAARLAEVGIQRLGELMARISHKGYHWHRGIAKLGPAGAARIVHWLGRHTASLGALPAPALAPRGLIDTTALTPQARAGIVPLERFLAPSDRDGSAGVNRAPLPLCKITARTDREAIEAWLHGHGAGSHTWRAYRKEAERCLLWAVLARHKALSSLDGDDCAAYGDFLGRPGPAWTGPRNTQRWGDAWRPFEGPLSPRSAAAAVTVVRTLCGWLVRQRYLAINPWHDLPRPAAAGVDRPAMPAVFGDADLTGAGGGS